MRIRYRYARSLLAGFLAVVLLFSLVPAASAAQQNSYHDPAENWKEALDRTNELDANAVVTHETFDCAYCNQARDFIVYRTPEYTRTGETALNRGVKFSDGTMLDGKQHGSLDDGTPGVDAYFTGYHWTKAVCQSCGTINANMGTYSYSYDKNVYWLFDCAANFFEDLPESVEIEQVDREYHRVITTGGQYCGFCYGTYHTEDATLERHHMETSIRPELAHQRFVEMDTCADCGYAKTSYTAAKAVVADYYGVADGAPHTVTVSDLSEAGVTTAVRYGHSADACTLTSAPNYTEAGNYTVYYEMSNIQLWMTPKRDFTVFFPWLHIVVLGSIQLSDLITTYLMYHYHWTYMNLFIAGLMIIVLLIQTICVKHFRFMRKFPLFGIDWLGAALWAALLAEIAFLFNYGDWYDWWNSPVIRQLSVAILITLFFCIWRMLTIRHPFLEPKMWSYRYLLPLLGLITLVEAFLATEHVLEEVFYEEVMKYEELVSVQLAWFANIGIVIGCVFSYWWMHIKHYNYVRLIIVGFLGLIGYLIGFYLTISTDIHISQLYLPTICRGFAYAVLSATFMVCLEEIMTFQHFFQSLSVFNMLHMVVGGVLGCAIYAQGLAYYVPDNLARYGAAIDHVSFSSSPFNLGHYMEEFISQMMEVSIKQIYGWVAYACIFLFLLLLLYDFPVRRSLKSMPSWKEVARDVKNSFWRTAQGTSKKINN